MKLSALPLDSASLFFVFFGLCAAVISNLSKAQAWRSAVLFIISLVFLVALAHDPRLLIPLAGFLLLGFCGLQLIEQGVPKAMVASVVTIVFAYIWLKKYSFLPKSLFLEIPYFTLGISYIFFRVLHLLIESGSSPEHRRVGLFPYFLYTVNFTTLVSGPIQRYDDFAKNQFAAQPLYLGARVVGLQLERIVRGFFKVNVLAIFLLSAHEDALSLVIQPAPLQAKLFAAFQVAVLYPFFLYANFSGYIDIVIALARLMRVRLPENFDRPFSASSFLDFWNRWHITLSTWFKAYVYNPLLLASMRRVASIAWQPYLGVGCFFVTFFLVGIWHGRTSEFVVYGVLQGGGIAVNKFWQLLLTRFLGRKGYQALAKNGLYIALGRGLTFSWFALTLIWLWADWKQINVLVGAIGSMWLGVWFATWICASAVLTLWEAFRAAVLSIKTRDGPIFTSRYWRVIYASALALMAFIMTLMLDQPAPGIVYKSF